VAVSGVPGDGSRVHTNDHDGSEAPAESPDSILSSETKPIIYPPPSGRSSSRTLSNLI
ncbi:hypothetical protein Tco_0485774, partial [Tanacetum coccineum]